MRSKPVEHFGKIIARPPFGDFVADDMIDMNSFGANLEPCRGDIMIRSKVRRGQAPTRHDLVGPGQTYPRRSRASRETRAAMPE